MRRRVGISAFIVAAAIVGSIGFATPAFAHNVLIASTPESGETLAELPPRFSATTNEAMLSLPGSKGFILQIQDATGAYYGDGCVEVVDATMSAVAAVGAPGKYTMLWQAISADGHSVSGEIPFTWAPATDVEAAVGSANPPVCGEAATPTPESTATVTATPKPSAEPEVESPSGLDLATAFWIGGGVIAAGIAAAIAIMIAGRRRMG